MKTTITDFEQYILQEKMQIGRRLSIQLGKHLGRLIKTHEFARLMLGDGKPEREVQRYTGLSSEEIRQIKREIENSRR